MKPHSRQHSADKYEMTFDYGNEIDVYRIKILLRGQWTSLNCRLFEVLINHRC
jgi:hypothetical protein